jgi:hypothetical protein
MKNSDDRMSECDAAALSYTPFGISFSAASSTLLLVLFKKCGSMSRRFSGYTNRFALEHEVNEKNRVLDI